MAMSITGRASRPNSKTERRKHQDNCSGFQHWRKMLWILILSLGTWGGPESSSYITRAVLLAILSRTYQKLHMILFLPTIKQSIMCFAWPNICSGIFGHQESDHDLSPENKDGRSAHQESSSAPIISHLLLLQNVTNCAFLAWKSRFPGRPHTLDFLRLCCCVRLTGPEVSITFFLLHDTLFSFCW